MAAGMPVSYSGLTRPSSGVKPVGYASSGSPLAAMLVRIGSGYSGGSILGQPNPALVGTQPLGQQTAPDSGQPAASPAPVPLQRRRRLSVGQTT
jgi:hypothetical protein